MQKDEIKPRLLDNIEQAFLQLEFSIKLLNYIELKKMVHKDLDTEVVISNDNLVFKKESFQTYSDIVHCAVNNFNITVGFTAIMLEDSLKCCGINVGQTDNEERIRTVIHLIRNAHAHNMMYPVWVINRKLKLPNIFSINLDSRIVDIKLEGRNNTPFEMSHIGGFDSYFDLKNAVCRIIHTGESEPPHFSSSLVDLS